jgi:hypothetical protein
VVYRSDSSAASSIRKESGTVSALSWVALWASRLLPTPPSSDGFVNADMWTAAGKERRKAHERLFDAIGTKLVVKACSADLEQLGGFQSVSGSLF